MRKAIYKLRSRNLAIYLFYIGKNERGESKDYQQASKPPLKFGCIENHKHINCVNYVVQEQDICMSPIPD
jgi:hypothetical protein